MDNLKMVIPGKPEYITMIRLAAASLAAQAGFDLEACEEIKMAVGEACKNVSCHGQAGYSDRYELDFIVGSGSFEVTVIDDCDCHTIEKTAPPCRQCPQEGDIGVIMIRSMMSCVEIGSDASGHKYINMVRRK